MQGDLSTKIKRLDVKGGRFYKQSDRQVQADHSGPDRILLARPNPTNKGGDPTGSWAKEGGIQTDSKKQKRGQVGIDHWRWIWQYGGIVLIKDSLASGIDSGQGKRVTIYWGYKK